MPIECIALNYFSFHSTEFSVRKRRSRKKNTKYTEKEWKRWRRRRRRRERKKKHTQKPYNLFRYTINRKISSLIACEYLYLWVYCWHGNTRLFYVCYVPNQSCRSINKHARILTVMIWKKHISRARLPIKMLNKIVYLIWLRCTRKKKTTKFSILVHSTAFTLPNKQTTTTEKNENQNKIDRAYMMCNAARVRMKQWILRENLLVLKWSICSDLVSIGNCLSAKWKK